MKRHPFIFLALACLSATMAEAASSSPCMRRMTITQDTTEVGYIDVEDRNCFYVLTAVAKPGYRFSHWSDGLTLISHEANHMEADYTAYFVYIGPSALPATKSDQQPTKYIQDGHLYIRMNDCVYDGLGNKQKGGTL